MQTTPASMSVAIAIDPRQRKLDARHTAPNSYWYDRLAIAVCADCPGDTRDTITRNAAVAGVIAGKHLHINVIAVCVAWLPRMI